MAAPLRRASDSECVSVLNDNVDLIMVRDITFYVWQRSMVVSFSIVKSVAG